MNVTYLANILNQRNDWSGLLQDVEVEKLKLKQGLRKNVEENKVNVKPLVAENERLTDRTSALKDETNNVIKKIGEISVQVNDCSKTINDLSESLANLNLNKKVLDRLVDISDLINNLRQCKETQNFIKSAECLKKIDMLIDSCNDLTSLKIFVSLCRDIDTMRDELLLTMKEIWISIIIFGVSVDENKEVVGIVVNKNNSETIQQIVRALLILQNTHLLDKFFGKVKDLILLPAINYFTEIIVEEKSNVAHLSVTIKKGSGGLPYLQIFEIIKTVVHFIKSHISDEIIEPMGQNMAQEVVSSLVKFSLSGAVLSPSGKLNSFEEIVRHAEDFQASLQELGFLPKQYVSFLNETDSAGLFFADKIYLSYLERARFLMKSDLHNTVDSEELKMPDWDGFSSFVSNGIKTHFAINNKSTLLQESQLISKSAQDVLILVETIINEMIKTDESHNKRLMFAVRNIFEMYGAIVPLHHAKLLSTIPHHIAIFHNNCLHFTFRLILLASECLKKWKVNLHNDYRIFLDQAVEMRQLAVTSLENCVSNQRNEILSIISNSGLTRLGTNPKLEEDTDKFLRQCIRQLELLKTAWIRVLPETIYSKIMSFLIDEFTEAVVAIIVISEDISKDSAVELAKMLTIVQNRLPAVFTDPREVFRLCRKWSRFKELIFVLEHSLDDFSERWCSGSGPLAEEFTKTEAQTLIRALFKNTGRRAAVLSTIYNSTSRNLSRDN